MREIRSETPLPVVFVDLTRFAAQSRRVDDTELGPALRRRVKEHTPAVTDVRLEDRRVG